MAEGFKIADAYVEIEADLDRDRLAEAVSSSVRRASSKIKNDSGKKLGSSLLDGVTESFGAGFKSAVSLGFSGLSGLGSALASNPITATIGIAVGGAIATAALGAIAAAFTAGLGLLAGGAVLGIGALILKDNKTLQKQLEKSFGNIKKNLEKAAAPLIGPFKEGLAALDDIVRELTPELKGLFKAVAPIVKIITDSLGPTLRPIIEGLKAAVPGITAAFSGLAKSLPRIGEAIGNFFKTIFQDKDLIGRVSEQIGDLVANMINILGPTIRFLSVTWGALTNVIHLFVKYLSEDVSGALANFEVFSGGAIGRITEAWKPFWNALKEIWEALVKLANADNDLEIAQAYVTLVEKIKAAWEPLKKFLGVIWDEILAVIKKWYNDKFLPWWENTAKPWLIEKIKGMASAAFEYLKTKALEKAKEVPGKILEGIKNLATDVKNDIVKQFDKAKDWLWNAGKSILQGLIDGIDSKIQELKNKLSFITGLIPDFKGPMSVDKKLLYPSGQAIMGGLQDGMESQVTALQRTLGALTNAIPQMVPTQQAAPAGITVSLAGAQFFGVGSADKFVADLYDALDRYEKRHR